MAKYRVRTGFYVHLDENDVRRGGEIIELSDRQASLYAHQIEAIKETKI